MLLSEYRKVPGAKSLRRLARDSKLSYCTVKKVAAGKLLSVFGNALRLSKATGGLVSPLELLRDYTESDDDESDRS